MVDTYHVFDLLVGAGIIAFASLWFVKHTSQRWLFLPVLIAGLFIVGFEAVLIYRYIAWETCPPMCGLQSWSLAVRLTLGIVILLMSSVTGGTKLWSIRWNGTTQ